MSVAQDIFSIKLRYRELFQQAHERLLALFQTLQADYHCSQCPSPPDEVTAVLHPGCGYRQWQQAVVITLEKQVGREVLEILNRIQSSREKEGSCHQCGACCSLASSEFDYQTLLDKASKGDHFAQQFTSVFIPYESADAAQAKFPQLVEEIRLQTGGDVFFYHCPHLTEDNLCGLYGDPRRPQMCADYPETPLVLMHARCGYQPWKKAMLPTTLLAHATLELCQHYVHQVYEALQAESN